MSLRRALVELCEEEEGQRRLKRKTSGAAHQVVLGDSEIRIETCPFRYEVLFGICSGLVLVNLAELGTELSFLAAKACSASDINVLYCNLNTVRLTFDLAVLKVTAARLSRVSSCDESAPVDDGSLEGNGYRGTRQRSQLYVTSIARGWTHP